MFAHENCRFTAKHWILRPRRCLGPVLGTKKHALVDLGVERALLAETEASAGKEMLRGISAMVVGF